MLSKTLSCLVLTGLTVVAHAAFVQEGREHHPSQDGDPSAARNNPLVRGLLESEGCLGVETASTSSGKSVIFAWFEDKGRPWLHFFAELADSVTKGWCQSLHSAPGPNSRMRK